MMSSQHCHSDRSEAKWRDLVFRIVGSAKPTLSFPKDGKDEGGALTISFVLRRR